MPIIYVGTCSALEYLEVPPKFAACQHYLGETNYVSRLSYWGEHLVQSSRCSVSYYLYSRPKKWSECAASGRIVLTTALNSPDVQHTVCPNPL